MDDHYHNNMHCTVHTHIHTVHNFVRYSADCDTLYGYHNVGSSYRSQVSVCNLLLPLSLGGTKVDRKIFWGGGGGV